MCNYFSEWTLYLKLEIKSIKYNRKLEKFDLKTIKYRLPN